MTDRATGPYVSLYEAAIGAIVERRIEDGFCVHTRSCGCRGRLRLSAWAALDALVREGYSLWPPTPPDTLEYPDIFDYSEDREHAPDCQHDDGPGHRGICLTPLTATTWASGIPRCPHGAPEWACSEPPANDRQEVRDDRR